jgi:hypothetical protein
VAFPAWRRSSRPTGSRPLEEHSPFALAQNIGRPQGQALNAELLDGFFDLVAVAARAGLGTLLEEDLNQ